MKKFNPNTPVAMFISSKSTLPYNRLLVQSLNKIVNLTLVESLSKEWIKENKGTFDIIHFQWTIGFFDAPTKLKQWNQVFAFMYFLFLIKKEGYKVVWTMHNIHPHDRSFFPYYIGSLFLAHCADAIIVHAENTKKQIVWWYGRFKNIFVIPYTTYQGYSKVYEATYPKQKARKELKLPENKFIYLFFGYIRKYKGVDILIKTFQKIKPANSVLLIAGAYWSEQDKKEIEAIANNDPDVILHTTEIIGKSVQQHMAAADVVVLPYRKVTTSGVLVLALTFGKPIIAINKGMIPEWVSEKNGIVIESENKLGNALLAIKEKDLYAMSEVSLHLSRTWSWSRIAQSYEEVYNKLLKK